MYEAKRHDANLVNAREYDNEFDNVKIPELDNRVIPTRGSCGPRSAEPRKYYVTPPRNREKFREQWRRRRAK